MTARFLRVSAALAVLSTCAGDCPNAVVQVAESVPLGVSITPVGWTTYNAWQHVIDNARSTLAIAAYYVTLTEGTAFPPSAGGEQGKNIYNSLIAAHSRGVTIRLVQNTPTPTYPGTDSAALAKDGVIELRNINWTQVEASGILHTKLMVADGDSMYVGSANCDWRSLTQVKELGLFVSNCSALCTDAQRIFETYWLAAENNTLPDPWPASVSALGNLSAPITVPVHGEPSTVYLAASPPSFAAEYRTDDLTALLTGIHAAQTRISIEVMDYFPTTLYMPANYYWPDIDTALRAAAFRGVEVRFLAGVWNHTSPAMYPYLHSLSELTNITVRAMKIPDQVGFAPAPYSRVNHAKFMVTERECYVGTSNWSGDYYISTGGVSYNWKSPALVSSVSQAFERDWTSAYSHSL
ncbi:Phospholipase D Y [Diplonema papillatum]|nr:Phospholipase D Y [Diplonema papillatum]